jgi:hypothetical protein
MSVYCLFLILLTCDGLLIGPNLVKASSSARKQIIILAGQSNMSGRGGVINNTWDGFVPLQGHKNRLILRLSANLTWVHALEPLHQDIDTAVTCGVGPGMVFANQLLDKDPKYGVLGLVPCAVGGPHGTKIADWARGTFLYNQLVTRAKASLRGGGRIRALLWYQGESDTINLRDIALYKGRLEKFFADFRADLRSPTLPIIQVAIASGQGPHIGKVRKAQFGINMTNVKCVDAKGLKMQPDSLHLSTPAQVRLGEMLATVFLQRK